MSTLATIGYEGATIADFVATLRSDGVEMLIDVRDVPVSRKPGFSKTALARRLDEAGIRYVHLRDLGNPKPGRLAGKQGDMQTFARIFRDHMAGDAAQRALDTALDIAGRASACLLCFERDPLRCHRTMVAEEMARRRGIEIRHLAVRHGLAETAERGAAAPGDGVH